MSSVRYKQDCEEGSGKHTITLSKTIHIGEYQLRAESLNLGFLEPVVVIHMDELSRLLQELEDGLRPEIKAFKLISSTVEDVHNITRELQTA